jgi:hypothetical protein
VYRVCFFDVAFRQTRHILALGAHANQPGHDALPLNVTVGAAEQNKGHGSMGANRTASTDGLNVSHPPMTAGEDADAYVCFREMGRFTRATGMGA